jgi:hypothetical protein
MSSEIGHTKLPGTDGSAAADAAGCLIVRLVASGTSATATRTARGRWRERDTGVTIPARRVRLAVAAAPPVAARWRRAS